MLLPAGSSRRRPVVLCILDGVGFGAGGPDDAVATARTPNLNRLLATCPHLSLRAHGASVGMPSEDDLGNSEVGHNAMGAGRVFDQGAKLVNRALADGSAFSGAAWAGLVGGRTLHLLGLFSAGNVHAHVDHVHAIVDRAVADGVRRIRLHLLTDGRDVPSRSALQWVAPLEERLAALRTAGVDARVASGGGRMNITMDRYEADWAMVARGWACHVRGEGRLFPSAVSAINTLYAENDKAEDQWLAPFVVGDDGPCGRIEDGDSVLLWNFRGDRAIEICRAFDQPGFDRFDTGQRPEVFFAGMMEYDGDLHTPRHFLVPPPAIDRTVGEYLVANARSTFACSETQKFGHVTYFFNGNRSEAFDAALETWKLVPSDLRPFDERPWMKAAEIADAAVEAIASGRFDHVRLNFANGDMVGHTGHLEATRVAVEAVDLQLGRLQRAVQAADGVLLVTADHGNADEMFLREKGRILYGDAGDARPRTAHTVARVPFVVYDPRGEVKVSASSDAGIAQIGATILTLCGLTPPEDYLPALVR